MAYGWTGKILKVRLSDSTMSTVATATYAERYVGGRGIASRLYWETVSPEIDAFDPENRLIFMTGPLVATGAQGATRMSVVAKSPMTYPEGYCFANMGGFFGAELKRAGFDGLIIEGRSLKPAYLWIYDNAAEILDASSLWGLGAYGTAEILRKVHGEKVRFVTTGKAGENRVRSAVIFGSHESTSCAGFGAVMGSKNLKAVAVAGTGGPAVADPKKLKELNRYTVGICERVTLEAPPIVMATNHAHLLEVIGKGHCDHCGLKCNRQLYRYGQKLEGYRRCQSMEYYLPWRYSREEEPLETFFDAPTMANDYSIDTFELQNIVDWLYVCHQSGSLTEESTGLPLSGIGTRDFLEELLHSVSCREGFGDILADGIARAASRVPREAFDMLDKTVAPTGQNDIFPARAMVAHALIYPMEPRVHQSILHEIGFVRAAWMLNQTRPDLSPMTTKIVHDVARAFWGSDEAGDLSGYEGKALAAKRIQNRSYLKDSLGLCDFAWPITYSFKTPGYVGDPDLEAKIFNAVTGVEPKELEPSADRMSIVQRAILVREGRKIPEDDFPGEFNFTEPLGDSPHDRRMLVPGPGEETVDATGKVLDRERITRMLKEYYSLRGWNEETGLPRPETLSALGLDDLMPLFRGR
jgi:aldehyde:ferredoxin oxidoreductase